MKKQKINNRSTEIYALTERGLAKKVQMALLGIVFYLLETATFLTFNGKIFIREPTFLEKVVWSEIENLMEGISPNENIIDETGKPVSFEDVRKFCIKSQKASTVKAILKISRSFPEMWAKEEDFDKDLDSICCLNGVVNLKNGQMQELNASRRITQTCEVEYDATATCPVFMKFLHKIFNDSKELIAFIQVLFGYVLTGETSEQKIFFLMGFGSNGKSTLLKIILKILGMFSRTVAPSTFMFSDFHRIRNDLAPLEKKRMVAVSEINQGQQADDAMIKQVTGGEEIVCRFLRHEEIVYTPRFKVLFATNNYPEIKGVDHGIKRRIMIIPFLVRIRKNEIIQNLDKLLEAEKAGIFCWMVEGAQKWYASGLPECKAVEEATRVFHQMKDPIQEFIDERCIVKESKVPITIVYQHYQNWAKNAGYKPEGIIRLGNSMELKGFIRSRDSKNRYINGIAIKN